MMINLTGICNTVEETKIFFHGVRAGITLMENFPARKNVNTGKPLKVSEMLSDIKHMEDMALMLVEKKDSK